MKLIRFELKKIFGVKYFWAFLAALFAANCICAVYSTQTSSHLAEYNDKIDAIFSDYNTNPEKYDTYYNELLEEQERQMKLQIEAAKNGSDTELSNLLPCTYTGASSFDDLKVLEKIYSAKKDVESYPAAVQKVVDNAYKNYTDYVNEGKSKGSYLCVYQAQTHNIYKGLKDEVGIELENVHGWGEYFDYSQVNTFIFLMLIIVGSIAFISEKSGGILPVIRPAKYGRRKTAIAKIAAIMIITDAVVLFFTISTFAIFAYRIGFSNGGNAIQALSNYVLCPFKLSILQLALIITGVKLLIFMLFSAIILLLSVLLYNYTVTYICGMAVYGISFLMYSQKFINISFPVAYMNFTAASSAASFFERYRAFDLFDQTVQYLPFMLIATAVFLIIVTAATAWTFAHGTNGVNTSFLNKIIKVFSKLIQKVQDKIVDKRNKGRRLKTFNLNLFSTELYKELIANKMIFIIIALIIIKCFISAGYFKTKPYFELALYKEYISKLEGPLNEEKEIYIADERTFIIETLKKSDKMLEAYQSGKITENEYQDYMQDFYYANEHGTVLGFIESYEAYLQEHREQTGEVGWFIYSDGWKALFGNSFDIILYIALLFAISGTFTVEYNSKSSSGAFAGILRTTKNGRKRTLSAKLLSSAAVSFILVIIFNCIDFIYASKFYDLPSMSAPLASIEMFGSYNGNMTIGQYLILFYVLRVLAAGIFALLICGISSILKKVIPVMSAIVAVTLLPALIKYFGIPAMKFADFTSFLTGTTLFVNSAGADFAGDFGFLAVFILASIVITAAVNIYAGRKYIK